MRAKIIGLVLREQTQEKIQAESYQSTISHELRTPLQNIMQVVEMILSLISSKKRINKSTRASLAVKLNLTFGQLALMEYFVEDLLNMRLLKEGLFVIQNRKFDLQEALDFIVAIFDSKSRAQEV